MSAYQNEPISENYDYIIIGAGAAGSVIANRLSADPSIKVCLLEAGQKDWHPYVHIPAGFIKAIFNPKLAWQFKTEASELTHNRQIPIPQGKVLGGSSSINGLVYNRGQQNDYDTWAILGNSGWSYKEVLPYFKRSEQFLTRDPSIYHGRAGEIAISDIDWIHPVSEAFMEGAAELGIPRNPDYNGASQAGVGYFQRFINNHYRVSTATSMLRKAKLRRNLTIKTGIFVSDILFKDKKAVAVKCHRGNSKSNTTLIGASKEIIVSSGAINTPKLLQLSGIGNGQNLRDLGIDVISDLPGVGENLCDHYSIRVVAKARDTITINELSKGTRLFGQIFKWLRHKPSIMALSPSLVHIFWQSSKELGYPDLQGVFSPASYKAGYVGVLDNYPGMTCGFWAHHPKSRGYVHLKSNNPFEYPVVQPSYLKEEHDQQVLIKAVHLARDLLRTGGLSRFFEEEVLPGPDVNTDDEILDFIKQYGVSSYHLNGTAKMGRKDDPNSVVDDKLCIHGVTGLRVADSSIMPLVPSANICAATIMIGEKASDMILGKKPLAEADLNLH